MLRRNKDILAKYHSALRSERPAEGAVNEPVHIWISPQFVDIGLLDGVVIFGVHQVWNNNFAADRARIVLLHDPAIETHRMEDVLRVALERRHNTLLIEVVKADSTLGFVLMLDWIEVFTG